MIDWILRGFAARYWRWRIKRRETTREAWTAEFMEWKRENPDRCMYCAYTRWARDAQSVHLEIGTHYCVEGKSPMPRAVVRS